MSRIKTTVLVTCATILLTAGLSSAQDTSSRLTRVTFTDAVELPCGTLAAGTYSFRLADPRGEGGRHTVQILDASDEKLVCTAMAMPARRLHHNEEENVITFRESAATAPAALRFWYYPNDLMGQEFAYPKERALAIAAASGESVLAVDDGQITRVEPTATTPEPEAAAIAEDTAPVGTSGRTTSARTLPRTASELPLIGLIGLIALGGALLARGLRATA